MSGIERRKHPRYPMEFPMTLLIGPLPARVTGKLLDISLGGCFLETDAPVALARRTRISFFVNGTECTAQGGVIRMHAMVGFGVQFEETNLAFEDFLNDVAALRDDLRPSFIGHVLEPVCRVE